MDSGIDTFDMVQNVVNCTLALFYASTTLVLSCRIGASLLKQLSPKAAFMVTILQLTPIFFFIYYLLIISSSFVKITCIPYLNFVYSVFDSLHNAVFLTFGFQMMTVDINFYQSITSPLAIYKKTQRVTCIANMIISIQLVITLLWILNLIFTQMQMQKAIQSQSEMTISNWATTMNIVYNFLNILILVPLNLTIYYLFWGMVRRLQGVFSLLRRPRVSALVFSVLTLGFVQILWSEVSIVLETIYILSGKEQKIMSDPFMVYLAYPIIRSGNLINDCMQAIIVLSVVHFLRTQQDKKDEGIVDQVEVEQSTNHYVLLTGSDASCEDGQKIRFNSSIKQKNQIKVTQSQEFQLRNSNLYASIESSMEESTLDKGDSKNIHKSDWEKLIFENFGKRATNSEVAFFKLSRYQFYSSK